MVHAIGMGPLHRVAASFQDRKMKRLFLTMLAMASLTSTAVAQDWVFAGTRVHSGTETINKVPTKYGFMWIRKDDKYRKNKDQFKKVTKKYHKSSATYIDFVFKSSKSYNYVAIYNIKSMAGLWKGSKKKQISYYKFYAGADKASIERKVMKDSQLYKYVAVRRVEMFDLKKKKLALNQQVKNPANGRSIK
jgi:hypothetical protein